MDEHSRRAAYYGQVLCANDGEGSTENTASIKGESIINVDVSSPNECLRMLALPSLVCSVFVLLPDGLAFTVGPSARGHWYRYLRTASMLLKLKRTLMTPRDPTA